jgi:hypothetical protein
MNDFKYAVEDSGLGVSGILSTSAVFNAGNKEVLRIAPDGFYVRGVKLEQDETEARRLFDALMAFMSGRGFDKTQVRNDAIEECAKACESPSTLANNLYFADLIRLLKEVK